MYPPPSQSMPQEPNAPPGRFQSLLIHLAGADPKMFAHLPPTEASDYAKMGFTVLIPCVLALCAGSFTIHTVQENKSVLVSVICGIVWAAMILGVDMAIMSQLVKRQAIRQPEGPRRAFAPAQFQPVPQPPPPSGKRRTILAAGRVLIAATLGLVMSHCLVLAMFKGRVHNQMETVRGAHRDEIEKFLRPRLDSLTKKLSAAQSVQATAKREDFLAAYEGWKAQTGQKTEPVKTPDTAPGGAGDVVAEAMKPFENQIRQLGEEARKIRERRDILQADLDSINAELLKARQMRREEWDGIKGVSYTWLTDAFRSTMPAVTSGIKGDGTRVAGIDTAIAGSEKIIAVKQAAIDEENKKFQAAEAAVTQAGGARNKQVSELLSSSTSDIKAKLVEYEERRKSAEKSALSNLGTELGQLEADLRAARAERDAKLAPVTGKSYDLLEQTEALHDLALGRNLEPGNTSKAGTVLVLILLVLICLMLIDLTPLLIKLSKEPGPYDYLVSAREHFSIHGQPASGPVRPQQPPRPGLFPPDAAPPPPPPRPPRR